MKEPDSTARELTTGLGRVGARDGRGDLPALFADTLNRIHAPVVGDDRRLQALQAPLREHRNPLIAAAAPLLDLILVLAQGASHKTPHDLRMQAASELREFHRRLEGQTVSLHSMRVASYALCGALDEAVLTTDWGSESDWSTETLLWTFHQDSSGGESFFRHLSDLALSPDVPVDLVELLVLLLDLGFQGCYRVSHDGAYALETIRLRLHATVGAHRSATASPVGTPKPYAGTDPSRLRFALRACGVCAVLALAIGYAMLYVRTQSLAEPLATRLDHLLNEYSPPSSARPPPSE